MEGNNWYNRTGYTDYRNHAQGDDRPLDQNAFRGAYRFDNTSDHRNQSTYNGFNHREEDENQRYGNRRAGQLQQNRDYERDWSGTYHNSRGAFDREDYNRNPNEHNRHQSNREPDRYSDGLQNRRFSNNLNSNPEYGPDNYRPGQGENYGNMAGSLSFGYDGTSNYNPDWGNRYDPMSGKIRSKHGNYPTRRPDFYDERDREQHPDEFRPFRRR